ncbi:MAG: hypothetical protein LN413_07020 [Candidatus Thermoplasmatota archaeon]|nr:hypothetical protein [Candidatus Thermoplasmatota archaeon]
MKDSAEEKRRNRLRELAAKLKADKDSSLARVLGWASLRWGSKSVRVREHLQDLENAGLIEVFEKEDEIHWLD